MIAVFYVIAAIFNLFIPDTGVRYPHQQSNPVLLVREFYFCLTTLGGWLGWALGAPLGMMTAFFLSIVGTALGVYAARRIARSFF